MPLTAPTNQGHKQVHIKCSVRIFEIVLSCYHKISLVKTITSKYFQIALHSLFIKCHLKYLFNILIIMTAKGHYVICKQNILKTSVCQNTANAHRAPIIVPLQQ